MMEPIYVDRLRKLAGFLRASRTYDQAVFYFWNCGAPACIAGHAAVMAGSSMNDFKVHEVSDYLGLPRSHDLFCCDASGWPQPYYAQFREHSGDTEAQALIAADLCDAIADGRVKL